MAKNTSGEILETARVLFNRNGFGRVTMAEIAQIVGIAEGNLWYHFKNKRALLEAINSDFIDSAEMRMEIEPGDGFVQDEFIDFQIKLAQELRCYRFMYRDQSEYGAHSPELEQQLPRIYGRTIEQYRLFVLKMREEGRIAINDSDIEMLCLTLVLIFRYGLEFVRESRISLEADNSPVVLGGRLQALVLSRFMPLQYSEEFETLLLKKLRTSGLSNEVVGAPDPQQSGT